MMLCDFGMFRRHHVFSCVSIQKMLVQLGAIPSFADCVLAVEWTTFYRRQRSFSAAIAAGHGLSEETSNASEQSASSIVAILNL